MKTITFEPSICKPQPVKAASGEANPVEPVMIQPEYSGTVTLRLPNYDERMAFYEGASDGDDKQSGLNFMRRVASMAKPFVTAIAIKRLEDGFEFNSWGDDFEYETDMTSVISEIAAKLVGKHRVGGQPST